MPELITPAEYARRRKEHGLIGGSKVAVHKAIRSGRLSLIDGKLDPDQADRDWNERTNAKQQRCKPDAKPAVTVLPPGPTPQTEIAAKETLAEAQARKESALAELRELELAQKAGELIEAAAVCSKWAEIGTRIRDEFMALPTRIVNRLPDEWRREVYGVVNEETRRALAAISDEFMPDQKAA